MSLNGIPTCADLNDVVLRTLGGLKPRDLPLTDEDRESSVMCGWEDSDGGEKRLILNLMPAQNPADLAAIRNQSGPWENYPPYHTQDFDSASRKGLFVVRDDSAAEYTPGCTTSMTLVVDGYKLALTSHEFIISQGVSVLSEAAKLLK